MDISIQIGSTRLAGILVIPDHARAIVLFAHGSGSSRLSLRNQSVARVLQEAKIATLLFDLLTEEEEILDNIDAHLRFDIELLANRLKDVSNWVHSQEHTKHLSLGYFGASTGAAAALVAAAQEPKRINAVVSRGGRPDLAGVSLKDVEAPTLLIVGSEDYQVLKLNENALKQIRAKEKTLQIVSGATHLFEEIGTLEQAARLAQEWFTRYL